MSHDSILANVLQNENAKMLKVRQNSVRLTEPKISGYKYAGNSVKQYSISNGSLTQSKICSLCASQLPKRGPLIWKMFLHRRAKFKRLDTATEIVRYASL